MLKIPACRSIYPDGRHLVDVADSRFLHDADCLPQSDREEVARRSDTIHFANSAVSGASVACSASPLAFRVVRLLDKNVVRDGIPGVMNADKEQ